MSDLLIIVCLVVIAGAAAYLGIDAIRTIARRRAVREPRTEPVSPVPTTPPAGNVRLHLVSPAEGPAPTTSDQPDECETSSSDEPAREESGADEAYVATLRAMNDDLKRNPGFTTELPVVEVAEPVEFDYHAALNDMEDRFRFDVEHLWDGWYDVLGVDPRTRLRLASSVEATGEIDGAELAKLLAEVSA